MRCIFSFSAPSSALSNKSLALLSPLTRTQCKLKRRVESTLAYLSARQVEHATYIFSFIFCVRARAIFLRRLCCVPCSIGYGLISAHTSAARCAHVVRTLCQEGNCITHAFALAKREDRDTRHTDFELSLPRKIAP